MKSEATSRWLGAGLLCTAVPLIACAAEVSPSDGEPGIVRPSTELDRKEGLQAEYAALMAADAANPGDPEVLAWAQDLNARSAEMSGLFYTIEVAPGHVVQFLQSSAGETVINESAPAGSLVLVGQTGVATFTEAFEYLRPGEEVPQVVLDADVAARTPSSTNKVESEVRADVAPEAAEPEFIEKHATSDCGHFEDGHNGCRTGDFDWCLCNRTGNSTTGSSGGTTHSVHIAASYGSSLIRITMTAGSQEFETTVSAGTVNGTILTNSRSCGCPPWPFACGVPNFCKSTHTARITSASGDLWHWGSCFDHDDSFSC